MNVHEAKSVHLIGVGGINMSAVAKLLLTSGIRVSGSDLAANDQTEILAARGATITIGENPANVPVDCDLIIYTSAAPATNTERRAGVARGIPEMTNFAFLGSWFHEVRTVVVAGTHGKSTTTALLGLMLERAGFDPTVIVGSKVGSFPDGNFRHGRSDWFVVEGDEYARHFLEFHPDAVILNNLELDHTDVFHTIDMMIQSFHELVGQVRDGGTIVANVSDPRIARLIDTERESLVRRGIRLVQFGEAQRLPSSADQSVWRVESTQEKGKRLMEIVSGETTYRAALHIPGTFNAMNTSAAMLMAMSLGAGEKEIQSAAEAFHGIWRRFEFLAEFHGASIYSDYAHHPTAVRATVEAARETFPGQRIVVCFQPHHRNRTKSFFLEFIPAFDAADTVILCEIYDVAGRDAAEDKDISSADLVDALERHDADRGVRRTVVYAPDPVSAVAHTFDLVQPQDRVLFMGAGDIDAAIRTALDRHAT